MANLNELWHYEDEVDRWAALHEFNLRRARWRVALLREGMAAARSGAEKLTAAFARVGAATRQAQRAALVARGIPEEWLDE